MNNRPYDLIVVGGGASGLMVAGRAGERGLRVLLLEKNRKIGEKLRIAGGGRCNITNAEEDEHIFLKKYGVAEKFLYTLFAQFGVKETFSFFESKGLPLITQAHRRVFPHTEKASDVVKVLENYARKNKVEIKTSSPVTKVDTKNNEITAVRSMKERYVATDYVFATGSVSHPETGSTGDGFKWLRMLGHTIAKPTPNIVPLRVKEKWVRDLSGITLPFMKITFFVDGKKGFSEMGRILFTHFGISGPLILNSSSKVEDLLHGGEVTALIDIYPRMDLGSLQQKIIKIFDANKNKTLKNIISDIVPSGTHKGISELLAEKIDLNTKVHSVTKDQRKIIVNLLKALPITIEGLMGFDRAVVADGGVALEEIDFKTMRSKKVSNLLVTGDLLHIKRPSGGYSLQLCWSTGFVAGNNARASK